VDVSSYQLELVYVVWVQTSPRQTPVTSDDD